MAILSVDLAFRRWRDLGIVVLDRPDAPDAPIRCEIVSHLGFADEPGPVQAEMLAGRLNHLCGIRGIRIMMLDGPQAWKSVENVSPYARSSELLLNTAAKTGLPGMVKPVTYRAFAEFCVDVYDALCRRGWKRLASKDRPGDSGEHLLVESYPYAAWRALGIRPLPAKRRATVGDLAEAFAALQTVVPVAVDRPPNHDQLQAIVGGLAGLAIESRNQTGVRIVGSTPRRENGHWREGFIVVPERARPSPRSWPDVRWMNEPLQSNR
jgi:hypothetical protein